MAASQQDAEDRYEDELDNEFFESLEEEFGQNEYFQKQEQASQKHQKKLKDLFNTSQLNKCYKILASRLHPDKEQDPLLKSQKTELMTQLSQAKKEKDAFTIISMFQQYVPNNDLNLDDDLNTELLTLLSEKSALLDQEYRTLTDTDSIESMIWQKLGGRTKKEVQVKQQQHLASLQESQLILKNIVATTKTMKPLNKILSDRYDERHKNPFANMDAFNLEALLNGDFDDF